MTGFLKWPSIERFPNVRSTVTHNYSVVPRIVYRGKIKLDGTNAAVRMEKDGKIVAQSRSRDLTVESDNYGFAAWVKERESHFSKTMSANTVLYGEWCGKGVQGRTSIAQLDKKVFVVYAMAWHTSDSMGSPNYFFEPRSLLPFQNGEDIFALPWYGPQLSFDFGDGNQMKNQLEVVNEMVARIEECDPWVKEMFGVEGLGEGIVFYPLSYSDPGLLFKVKGEKHEVVKAKTPASLDPEFAKNVDDFVEMFVTENRLQQAATEVCPSGVNIQATGEFLKWVAADVIKESKLELEASKLEWSDVAKFVNKKAATWFKGRCNQ